MSSISLSVPFPLDNGRFLRRECPLCFRQFKVETDESDQQSLVEQELEAYLLQEGLPISSEDVDVDKTEEAELWCPYCGQSASREQWWTQEQIEYIHVFCYNIMATAINEQMLRPLKRQFSGRSRGLISVKFEGEEMEYREPWISPEPDDMTAHILPCCNLAVKVEDSWTGPIYCHQCGFMHTGLYG